MLRHLIALDLDGTVLNHGAVGQDHREIEIEDELASAIRNLYKKGHEVVLSTGRSADATLPVVEKLKITPRWVVTANGAVTLKRDPVAPRAYRREYVESFDATELLKKLRPQIGTARFAVETAEGVFWYTEPIPAGTLPSEQKQVPFEKLLGVQASRVVVVAPDRRLEEFVRAADTVGYADVSYQVGDTTWLDIAPVGVTKDSALEVVLAKEKIDRAHVFAAGDGQNDITMLRWAGRYGKAVAMGQAAADVKAVATHIAGSISENGLLYALREHFGKDI